MPRLILMRKGDVPVEKVIKSGENDTVLSFLERVWKGELDGIMVMRS